MQVCTTARARATIGGPMRESRTPCNAAAFHRTTRVSLVLDWPNTATGQIRAATVSKNRRYKGRLHFDVDDTGILAAIETLPPAIVEHRIYANHLFSVRIDTATASRGPVPARRGSYFTRHSMRRAFSTLSRTECLCARYQPAPRS